MKLYYFSLYVLARIDEVAIEQRLLALSVGRVAVVELVQT